MITNPIQPSPVEHRIATLEQQVAAILRSPASTGDWASTVGTWKDDSLSREMDQLGEEWRQSATD